MAGLSYRIIGNLHARVFNVKTSIMTTSNEFTACRTRTGMCCKNVSQAFSTVHVSYSKDLVYLAYAEF